MADIESSNKVKQIVDFYAAITSAAQKLVAPSAAWLNNLLVSDYVPVETPADHNHRNPFNWYLCKVRWLVSPLQFDSKRKESAFSSFALLAASIEAYALFIGLAILYAVSGAVLQQQSRVTPQGSPIETWIIILAAGVVHLLSFIAVYMRLGKVIWLGPPTVKMIALISFVTLVAVICLAPALDMSTLNLHYSPISLTELWARYSSSLIIILSTLLLVIIPAAGGMCQGFETS